eukprot:352312-Chlamydomonas_euryale.AAC.24
MSRGCAAADAVGAASASVRARAHVAGDDAVLSAAVGAATAAAATAATGRILTKRILTKRGVVPRAAEAAGVQQRSPCARTHGRRHTTCTERGQLRGSCVAGRAAAQQVYYHLREGRGGRHMGLNVLTAP